MKIGKAKEPGIAGYSPPRTYLDPRPEGLGPGRPTNYRPEYCQSIVEYFASADSWEINYDLKNSGKVLPKSKLPTLERWAYLMGVGVTTVRQSWPAKHPEFAQALETAQSLQKAFLLELGAAGVANHVTALMLRTHHGMKDEKESDEDRKDDTIQRVVVEVVGASQHKGD